MGFTVHVIWEKLGVNRWIGLGLRERCRGY